MKKITTLFSAMLFVGAALAQFSVTWNSQYQHTTTTNYSNEARRIIEDPSGNVFVMMDVTSDIDPTGLHGTGSWNYVVLNKYSPNGVLLNSININIQKHIYSGYNNLGAFGLEVDAAGNIYTGYITWNSITNFDVALSKYNNSLVRQWTNTYGGNGDDIGVDMKLHSNGNIYAVVKSTNVTTEYSIIKSVNSSNPAVLVYTYAPNSAVIRTIALDNASRAYVGGYSMKGVFKNAYIGCVNITTNTLAWNSIYTPSTFTGDDMINKIVVGVDGNVYSTGITYQGVNNGNQVLAIRNLANNPRLDFVRILGNMGVSDNGVEINAAESGWVYIGSVSGVQAVVYRFPSNGIFTTPGKATFGPTPASAYNSIDALTLNSMKISSAKNIYITGGVTATDNQGQFVSSYFEKASVVFGNALVKVGGLTVEGAFGHNLEGVDLSLDYGKADVYWIRSFWDDTHSVERVEVIDVNVPAPLRESSTGFDRENINVTLSPNPARNQVTISSESLVSSVEVIDLTGNRVLFIPVESNQSSLDVSSLSNGIYFCKVKTEQGELIKRLVIN